MTDPRLEGRDLKVLCLFGRHIDRNGWCRRSQVKMAAELGCARSTLQGSIERLVDAGWLIKRSEKCLLLSSPGILLGGCATCSHSRRERSGECRNLAGAQAKTMLRLHAGGSR